MQQPELVLVHTSIRYDGSPIAVMGRPDTGLLVVVDFDTPAARAVGLITAHERCGRIVYRVVGHLHDLTSVTAAAEAVIAERGGASSGG
jgi:hypothetical protein